MITKLLALGILFALALSAGADGPPAPFAKGDAKLGAALVSKDCVACHARRFDGDADRIYLRADRKVRTAAQLAAQITYCSTELGTAYFPDEEEHVAAYLNQRYYHFK
ncbi:MAG: cytochrome c [Casimicrobiaceae bacterium]